MSVAVEFLLEMDSNNGCSILFLCKVVEGRFLLAVTLLLCQTVFLNTWKCFKSGDSKKAHAEHYFFLRIFYW